MQRIAGSYLLASPRFSENLSSAPAGKDQGLLSRIFSAIALIPVIPKGLKQEYG